MAADVDHRRVIRERAELDSAFVYLRMIEARCRESGGAVSYADLAVRCARHPLDLALTVLIDRGLVACTGGDRLVVTDFARQLVERPMPAGEGWRLLD